MSEHQSQLLDWPTVESVLRGSRLTLLYGPPGTGKTTAAVNAARDLGVSAWNVTLTDETPAAELRGHWVPTGSGAWSWMDGPALAAFRAGGVLVLNEIDHAGGDALDFCHALLDDPGVARMTLPSGETVFPDDGFRVVATMNGDPGDLPDPIRDRLTCRIYIGTPHPGAIAALPEDLREAAENTATTDRDPDRPATLRAWKVYGDLRDEVGRETAAAAVFAHRASEIVDALDLAGSR